MCKLNEPEIEQIRSGNDAPLGRLYGQYRQNLITGLRSKAKTQHSIEDMEDALQEAFFVIRSKIKSPDFKNDNVCGYIIKIAHYKLLDQDKKTWRFTSINPNEAEKYISAKERGYESSNIGLDHENQTKVDIALEVLEEWKGPCKELLWLAYYNDRSNAYILEKLKHKNKNVLKSSKSRCLRRWREKINERLSQKEQTKK